MPRNIQEGRVKDGVEVPLLLVISNGLQPNSDGLQPTSFLFLLVMPGGSSSFLLLVAMPLLLVARCGGAPSSFLVLCVWCHMVSLWLPAQAQCKCSQHVRECGTKIA